MFYFDGTVDLSVNSEAADIRLSMIGDATKYSDSFGILNGTRTDDIVRAPTFAALYRDSYGFGVSGLASEVVTASVGNSTISVDIKKDDGISLLPVLQSRFELISGVEIDPNFVVKLSEVDFSGLLTGWVGSIQQIDTAFWDGSFAEEYAVCENFDSRGSWVLSSGSGVLTTDELLARSTIHCVNSQSQFHSQCEQDRQ